MRNLAVNAPLAIPGCIGSRLCATQFDHFSTSPSKYPQSQEFNAICNYLTAGIEVALQDSPNNINDSAASEC